jgi:phage gpG-like protein
MAGFVTRLQKWSQQAPKFTRLALSGAADIVIARSRSHYFTRGGGQGGPLLHVRSGRLWRSIHKTVATEPELRAEVGSNVAYARIHELGGMIKQGSRGQLKIGSLFASTKQAMAKSRGNWKMRGRASYVLIGEHSFWMPARPYLSTALRDVRPEMLNLIRDRLMELWSKEALRG